MGDWAAAVGILAGKAGYVRKGLGLPLLDRTSLRGAERRSNLTGARVGRLLRYARHDGRSWFALLQVPCPASAFLVHSHRNCSCRRQGNNLSFVGLSASRGAFSRAMQFLDIYISYTYILCIVDSWTLNGILPRPGPTWPSMA